MKFVNGGSIETLPFVGGVTRGNRCNIIGCECYDTETGDIVVAEIDMRKMGRYIPLFLADYRKQKPTPKNLTTC